MSTALVLADTSVWINHLRYTNERLVALLEQSMVLVHPFVRGELACGNLRNRAQVLAELEAMPSPEVALDEEVFGMLERRQLWGQGIGWIDAHLTASALLTKGCSLWTLDGPLRKSARKAGASVLEDIH